MVFFGAIFYYFYFFLLSVFFRRDTSIDFTIFIFLFFLSKQKHISNSV